MRRTDADQQRAMSGRGADRLYQTRYVFRIAAPIGQADEQHIDAVPIGAQQAGWIQQLLEHLIERGESQLVLIVQFAQPEV